MVDAISSAVSGLLAQSQRLGVAANNIANAVTTGRLPTAAEPTSTVYKPLSVSYNALTVGGQGAGVMAHVTEDAEGYSPVFDPTSIHANAEGFIAAPNVDLAQESISVMQAKLLYRANLSVIKTHRDMLGELMDILK